MRPKLLTVALLTGILVFVAAAEFGGLQALFSSNYLAHRYCYLIQPALIWTNVLADTLIALSYVALFTGLMWAIGRLRLLAELRRHLWVFSSFGAFILACGITHTMEVITIWWPVYRLSAALKVVCALISLPTAVLFTWKIRGITGSLRGLLLQLAAAQEQTEALRKSEQFLDRTGKIAGIGGWEVDLETSGVTWSAETYRIHGAPLDYRPTLEEGIEMYAVEARPILIAAIARASGGGPGWDLELPVIRVDGRRITVRTVGEADISDGKPIRLFGAFQDITEQVAAREALRKANERAVLATDSGGIGIFVLDLESDICTADPWIFRLYNLQYTSELTPADFWLSHIHAADRQLTVDALADAVAGPDPFDTEFRVIWQDGSVHNIRATGKVTRDSNSRAVSIVGANWEVTEARRLTAELAEQHELLRLTLQSVRDGVITTDVDRKVSWLNPVAESLTGWTVAEACGKPLVEVFSIINAQNREFADNPVANFNVQGNPGDLARQIILLSRSGSETGIESQSAPIRGGHGELMGSILVFRDVTEQRRLAAEKEKVSELQLLQLKTKDEFLSHVSHELRSPLASIYSFSSIIADDLAGETTAEQKEYLQIILKNVVQLQSMIEDLLTVTQTREGKLSIELQRVEPLEAIDYAIHTLSSAASTKQVYLTAAATGDVPPACADPTRLRQVLTILLDNAIKFTPQGGTVAVAVSHSHQNQLLFQVTDSGCGIPEEKRTLVFENLYQITGPAPPDTSQQGRIGLGLGLHIARNLVTRQGGTIWVTAAPGGGSVFNFTLPAYTEGCLTENIDADHPRRRKTDRQADERSNLLPAA